ncbi:RNA polymerase sigma factor [Paenibacillus sp. 1P03SA]|uniref:RNA polymerase sigma factor n=1 Tax=Paenibacillus sp. 1P03SA TaxID=3132294 RepID=UPI00399FA20A
MGAQQVNEEGKPAKEQFRTMMLEYGQDVWNYAFFLTGRRELADDISQDVFLSVFRHLDTFEGKASVKTWLFAITRNTARNHMRTAFMRRVILVGRARSGSTHPSAESEVMEAAFTDEIWEVVMKLSPKFREVLVLDAKYDMTMGEIAQVLGVSEGTVKSRLSRARKKVSAVWKEESAYERA